MAKAVKQTASDAEKIVLAIDIGGSPRQDPDQQRRGGTPGRFPVRT